VDWLKAGMSGKISKKASLSSTSDSWLEKEDIVLSKVLDTQVPIPLDEMRIIFLIVKGCQWDWHQGSIYCRFMEAYAQFSGNIFIN
jgi:hypothetical protein